MDTLVSTEDGLRPIEEIQAGDYVWSENTETGKKELKKVLSVSVTETKALVHVTTENGTVVNTTENHPFYVEGKGWCAAADLEDGDVLRTQDGETETVESVQIEKLDKAVKVYNLEIEDSHTYYVSADRVLVHNACERHHIASDKAHTSGYTDQYAELFGYAGENLQYNRNIIPLENHRGGHTIAYKEWVLDGLKKYIKKDNTTNENKKMLDMVLDMMIDALKENSRLPYSDGKDTLKEYSWD